MHNKLFISDNWKLHLSNNNGCHTLITHNQQINASVPGTVHTDLFNNSIIDDPYYSDNELKLGWISECDWNYSAVFDIPEELKGLSDLAIVFEGIDTIADIYLNDKLIGSSANMFMNHKFILTNELKPEGNKLEVRFMSALKYARQEEGIHGKLPVSLNSERVYIRKAQYSFGWDWGPSFPTMGIWKPVYLVKNDSLEINDIVFSTVKLSENSAEVKVQFNPMGKLDNVEEYKVTLSNSRSAVSQTISKDKTEKLFKIEDPLLWWPNGLGEQNLYELKIEAIDIHGEVTAETLKKVGIRTIELELEKEGKQNFKFIINGKSIYAKGVNWIPGDSFLPRVTHEKYFNLLSYAKEASMNIVRVWGGGIYENDEFYDLCDQLGLLVWQDFMFACGAYPEHEEFMDNVKQEVTDNVKRLRNHPSIAIWCGNNENEWIWSFRQETHYSQMPGYNIYHKLIPEILEEIDSSRPYWPSSPFGSDKDPNSQTSGNRHQWNIWSHWIDYTEVIKDNSLFVTEFGFQGPANKETFEKYLPEENRCIHDPVFEFHNKQIEGPERVLRFLAGHLPLPNSWQDYLYLAQLNQGFALKTCLEHWRTNEQTNGSIIWQINDTWPVTSWALIDSELKPKMSYCFVKNAFHPVIICGERDDEFLQIKLTTEQGSFDGKVDIKFIELRTGNLLNDKFISISEKHAGTIEVTKIKLDAEIENNEWIAIITLYDSQNRMIHRNYYTDRKWKHVKIAEAGLSYSVKENQMTIKTEKPAYFVDVQYPGIVNSDRGFILLPGENYECSIDTIGKNIFCESELRIYSLNDYLKS